MSDDDVETVLKAIRDGRVFSLAEEPYDPALWDEEAVRDWLEHAQSSMRARQNIGILRSGRNIYSRLVAPTVEIALKALIAQTARLEQEIAALRAERV